MQNPLVTQLKLTESHKCNFFICPEAQLEQHILKSTAHAEGKQS